MTNTIRLKITCFLLLFTVLLIKGILDLAWHLATRMKFGTCEQNWDLYGTISGLSPKFGTSFKALFLLFGFFIFRDQTFRNRDFFPRPNFFETETFFRNQIFLNRNPQRFGKSFETEMSISGWWATSRAQRVGVFNFGTDRVRVLEKIFRDGSGMDWVRVFSSCI